MTHIEIWAIQKYVDVSKSSEPSVPTDLGSAFSSPENPLKTKIVNIYKGQLASDKIVEGSLEMTNKIFKLETNLIDLTGAQSSQTNTLIPQS